VTPETLDVRPSTSTAAAVAMESSSSAPTEPFVSYAMIEEAIMDEISVTGWSTAVAFSGIYFRVGLVIDCVDEDSADWLVAVAPRLSSWKGVPLDIRMGTIYRRPTP